MLTILLQKIIYIKKNTTSLHIRDFFSSQHCYIFYKKSSLQILCDKYIFCKKIACKKILKEINVRKFYVPNFILKKEIHFTNNLPNNFIS